DDEEDEEEEEIPPNNPPWVRIWWEKDGLIVERAIPGDTIEIHAEYGDPDGDPLARLWTYHGPLANYGLSRIAEVPTFQVDVMDWHDVSITVTDPQGLTATAHASLQVIDPKPVAVIIGPPAAKQGRPLPYEFDGSRSRSPIGLDLVEYDWT